MVTERTGTIPAFAERQRIADRSEQGAWAVDAGTLVPLWDVIDQSWTSKIPQENTGDYLARKVLMCSVCNFTAMDEEVKLPDGTFVHLKSAQLRLQSHVRLTKERAEQHEGAEIIMTTNGERPVRLCTGCDAPFSAGAHRAQIHLTEVRDEALRHSNAVEGLLIHRFSQRPSELAVLERIHIAGPEAHLVERSSVPRQARRRRKRNRSRR